MATSEAKIGVTLRKVDAADQLAFRIEDRDTVESLLAHPPTDPQIAIDVHAQSVGSAVGFGRDECLALRQCRSRFRHVKRANDAGRDASLNSVQLRLVGRERK